MVPADAKGTIREIVLPKGLDLDRPKRTRTSFTAEQLYRLELEFQRCQYVVGRERTELARQLNLSETQVSMQGTGISWSVQTNFGEFSQALGKEFKWKVN